MEKSKKFAALVLLVSATAMLAAGDNVNQALLNINKEALDTVQTGTGDWLRTIMGWLPVALFFVTAAGTMFYQMKKSEASQENDYIKIGLWTVFFAFIAGVAGYALDAMIGAFLLGNASCGTEVFTTYWKQAVGIMQQGAASYNCQ